MELITNYKYLIITKDRKYVYCTNNYFEMTDKLMKTKPHYFKGYGSAYNSMISMNCYIDGKLDLEVIKVKVIVEEVPDDSRYLEKLAKKNIQKYIKNLENSRIREEMKQKLLVSGIMNDDGYIRDEYRKFLEVK